MASKIKVDTLETANGTGSITLNNPIASPSFTGNVVTQGVNPTITIQDSDEAGDGFIKFKTANGTQRGYIQTAMTSDVMIFGTGTTERMRLISSGGLTFNGDTAAANALDDYEEGTWTPAYTVGSSGYSNQVGKYTKIGEQVTAYFYLQMNNNQVGGSTLHVGGLPFTCNSNSSYGAASGFHCNSWSTSAKKPDNGLVAPNNTVIDLYHSQGTTATTQPLGTDIGTGSLIGCVVYRTSS